jgi:hypothetical protein
MSNFLIGVLKVTVAILCYTIGLIVGILEILFYDNRRHNLDN